MTNHTWHINGQPADLADLRITPIRLTQRFGEGATLTLRQEMDHHKNALAPGDTVVYSADGTARFTGRVVGLSRTATGEGTDAVDYRIADAQAEAVNVNIELRYIEIPNDDDLPLRLATVQQVIVAALGKAGQSIGGGFGDLDRRANVGSSFVGSLAELLELAMRRQPKHRLVVDGSGVWQCVQVIDAGSTSTLTWGGGAETQANLVGRIASLSLSDSTDGCATAVELVYPETMSAGVLTRQEELEPAWGEELEELWYLQDTGQDEALWDLLDDEWSRVYRAWRVTDPFFDPNRPWQLRVRVPADPRVAFSLEKWVSVQADYVIAEDGALIVAKHPITVRGNVRIPGKARGPSSVMVSFQVDTEDTEYERVRVPASGYEGSAYTLYGVERLRRVEKRNPDVVTAGNAQVILDALKNVKHSGAISVYGAMPSWAWTGGHMVRVAGRGLENDPISVDYAGIDFIQTGWEIDFERDVYDVVVSDDRSALADLI